MGHEMLLEEAAWRYKHEGKEVEVKLKIIQKPLQFLT